MHLVLIRHGESEWNRLALFTGWRDVELSEKGKQEAFEAGHVLSQEGFDFDVCYTSYLKRAIHTLNIVLEAMDRDWLPVVKSWKLNERHYGALQGLNKAETADKYGEDQVRIWRRSFDVLPPALDEMDPRNPRLQEQYRNEDKRRLPLTESLKTTIDRVIPYYRDVIEKDIAEGKRVVIVSHGNALRALVKYLDHLTDEEIVDVNIPTGVPLVYALDENLRAIDKQYIGNPDDIARRTASAVAIQQSAPQEGTLLTDDRPRRMR